VSAPGGTKPPTIRREPFFAEDWRAAGFATEERRAWPRRTPDTLGGLAFLVRGGVPRNIVDLAIRLAASRGTEARQELFAIGFDRQRYWSMLAADLGLQFASDLEDATLLAPAGFLTTEAVGRANSILVHIGGCTVSIRAPDGEELPLLEAALREPSELAGRLRIAAPETIRALLVNQRHTALSHYAINRLAHVLPRFSARRLGLGTPKTFASVALGVVMVAPLEVTHAVAALLGIMLTVLFLNCGIWKLAVALARPARLRLEAVRTPDLPTYSVLVPLYREAAVVPDLLNHLLGIDYPASKLQILIILEADDLESRLAVALHAGSPLLEVVVVPPAGPRTKPKALTYALPFVRGDLLVVYDAEDRPEPDQLRKAAAAFRDYPGLGCVQAGLQPDNQDSWLARMFTIEYAAIFDVLLPALSAWDVPLPLGGTSNHLPRHVVEAVGAWDPYNVTEDADLGIRLARFGYPVATIDSRTFEEAPVRLSQWLPQRRRWIKGWMQTAALCFAGRVPAGLRLPVRQSLAVHAVITAGVLGLLLYPVSILILCATLSTLLSGHYPSGVWAWLFLAVTLGNFAMVAAASAIAALRGLRATRALRLAPLIPSLLVYWGLMSFAAWWALAQFLGNHQDWEKTTHGVARHRRTPAGIRRIV
jgi:cellulose synthase/poly-beta-1,6-N-acetylglucosamine synthase-like glycosyltransferase